MQKKNGFVFVGLTVLWASECATKKNKKQTKFLCALCFGTAQRSPMMFRLGRPAVSNMEAVDRCVPLITSNHQAS